MRQADGGSHTTLPNPRISARIGKSRPTGVRVPREEPQDWRPMVFTKRLREGIRRGRIKCSVRIWMRPHVKAGGRYRMDEGQIVVESIRPIRLADITHDLARESGFTTVKDLLETARHGPGDHVYLIRFHYLPPGAWDAPRTGSQSESDSRTELLRRIRAATPTRSSKKTRGGPTAGRSRRRGE
jgi:hypothetical protein